MKIKDVIHILEVLYPQSLASDFDTNRIGFTIGSFEDNLHHILLTLDLTLKVVEEAIDKQVNLIITHHPFFYTPLQQILLDEEKGQIIAKMLHHRINLYTMHTNLDVGSFGVNDTLAAKLSLQNIQGTVEKDHFIRYGHIEPMRLYDFAQYVKKHLNQEGVRIAGHPDTTISQVGIIGGSGGQEEECIHAKNIGCDCLITGEIKLHIAQFAQSIGLNLIEVAHSVESFVFENTQRLLKNRLQKEFQVYISHINTDPLQFV